MSGDPLTRRLARWGWAAWMIIVICVGYGVASGWDMDVIQPARFAWLDAIVTTLCGFAVAALVITQILFDAGAVLGRIGRWFALAGLTVIAARFIFAEALLGEVPVHPASVAAIGAVSLSVIIRQVEIWADAHFGIGGADRGR